MHSSGVVNTEIQRREVGSDVLRMCQEDRGSGGRKSPVGSRDKVAGGSLIVVLQKLKLIC